VLAVSELAANSLRHTDGGGTVQVWPTGGEIICQVADTGEITDPLAGHRARSTRVAEQLTSAVLRNPAVIIDMTATTFCDCAVKAREARP
jgi:hypothetical protein